MIDIIKESESNEWNDKKRISLTTLCTHKKKLMQNVSVLKHSNLSFRKPNHAQGYY